MQFDQASGAPIVIEFGGNRISIPKFSLDDFVAWSAEMDAAREKKATDGMTREERFRVLSFYNVMPADAEELKALARVPFGMKRINSTCIPRAKIIAKDDKPIEPQPITAELQAAILSAPLDDQKRLAVLLADAYDRMKPQPKADAPTGDTLAEEGSDPLPQRTAPASSA